MKDLLSTGGIAETITESWTLLNTELEGLSCAGEIVHTHTGANKAKLEHYMRQFLPEAADVPEYLFPVQQQC